MYIGTRWSICTLYEVYVYILLWGLYIASAGSICSLNRVGTHVASEGSRCIQSRYGIYSSLYGAKSRRGSVLSVDEHLYI
jgi:hypothetical protein